MPSVTPLWACQPHSIARLTSVGTRAHRDAVPDPARRQVAHPRLGVGLGDPLHLHAAQRVREVVVLGARHRVGQPAQPELLEPGQELLEVLAAERPPHDLRRPRRSLAVDERQDDAGQVAVVELGDGAQGRLINGHERHPRSGRTRFGCHPNGEAGAAAVVATPTAVTCAARGGSPQINVDRNHLHRPTRSEGTQCLTPSRSPTTAPARR